MFANAVSLAEPGSEKSVLLGVYVRAFMQRLTARHLAALGGQAADIELAHRRREVPAA